MNHHYGRPPRSASKSTKNSSSPAPPLGLPQTRSHRSSASPSYDFQMMDVQIGIDIMEGLVMECIKNKGESPLGSTQINAIVSCNKNVSRSRQIATHVPSLPLTVPVASFGDKVHNFLVRWPADFDPHGDALSTFKLSRLLKRDAYYSDVPGINTGFVPDEIELSIGLMRGSEILTLGKTNLIITGNETDEMIIDLPISNEKEVVKNKQRDPSPLKRTSSKLFGKSPKSNVKSLKPLSFSADKVRKFHLTDNAMIRLRVQLFPRQESGSFDMPATASRTRPYIVQHGSPSHDYSSYSREDSTDSSSNDSYSGHIHHHEYIPSVPPHKYHPHIPMDELEQDFGHVLHVRNVNGGHSSSRPAPSTLSISKNSRQERSYVEDFSPDKYDMRLHERNSSSAYKYETFGGHSSQVDRARTPGKSRMMYDRHQTHSNQYVLQNDRRYSRSRQSQMKTKPIQYLTNGGVSYEVSDEDTENINFHQSGRVETKVPLKHSSGKPRSSNHSERNESPMTWLYDKIIGGNPSSTTESLTTSRHSNHKKSPSYHRNNSTKRTMRV